MRDAPSLPQRRAGERAGLGEKGVEKRTLDQTALGAALDHEDLGQGRGTVGQHPGANLLHERMRAGRRDQAETGCRSEGDGLAVLREPQAGLGDARDLPDPQRFGNGAPDGRVDAGDEYLKGLHARSSIPSVRSGAQAPAVSGRPACRISIIRRQSATHSWLVGPRQSVSLGTRPSARS